MPVQALTPRQQHVLELIRTYLRAYRYAPTIDEIRAEFEWASPTMAHRQLTALERKGWIRRKPYRHRAITIVEGVTHA